MSGQGHRIFLDELERFAAEVAGTRCAAAGRPVLAALNKAEPTIDAADPTRLRCRAER